ncbi:GNAT family N-acetyltransferase [Actinopolymorpha sp. B11F2]|uniref:GNAT family N-acetyltransferase n=1 Tax=Actinopolymorpha sp. B11F2 TaxID=3160862 RepID=UPI0032E4DD01
MGTPDRRHRDGTDAAAHLPPGRRTPAGAADRVDAPRDRGGHRPDRRVGRGVPPRGGRRSGGGWSGGGWSGGGRSGGGRVGGGWSGRATRGRAAFEGRTALERRRAELRVGERRAYLWEDGGEPVSYVGATNPAGGIVRVAPVYTPTDRRGRGYASALVAGVSQAALDAGATACSLYTDLANPTSNKIYAAVGYHPVCDVTNYRFGDR